MNQLRTTQFCDEPIEVHTLKNWTSILTRDRMKRGPHEKPRSEYFTFGTNNIVVDKSFIFIAAMNHPLNVRKDIKKFSKTFRKTDEIPF